MTLLLYFNGMFIEVSGSLSHMHEDFGVYFHAYYSLKTYFLHISYCYKNVLLSKSTLREQNTYFIQGILNLKMRAL